MVVKDPEDQIRVTDLASDGATREGVSSSDRNGATRRNGSAEQGPLPCAEGVLHDRQPGVVAVAEDVSDFVGENGEKIDPSGGVAAGDRGELTIDRFEFAVVVRGGIDKPSAAGCRRVEGDALTDRFTEDAAIEIGDAGGDALSEVGDVGVRQSVGPKADRDLKKFVDLFLCKFIRTYGAKSAVTVKQEVVATAVGVVTSKGIWIDTQQILRLVGR